MAKRPAAKSPAAMVIKVTMGYTEVGIGALIGVAVIHSSCFKLFQLI